MKFDMKVELLTEDTNYGYRLSGPFCAAERMNRNGRIYQASDLKRETLKLKEKVDNGEELYLYLDHPDHIDLVREDSCAIFESISWNDQEQIGKCSVKTLTDTKDGKKVNEDLSNKTSYGISTRGLGSVNEKTKIVEDYEMITADLIRNKNGENQSCQICTLKTLHESKDSLTEREINSLDDFLVEAKTKYIYSLDNVSDEKLFKKLPFQNVEFDKVGRSYLVNFECKKAKGEVEDIISDVIGIRLDNINLMVNEDKDCGCQFEKLDDTEKQIVRSAIVKQFTNIWEK